MPLPLPLRTAAPPARSPLRLALAASVALAALPSCAMHPTTRPSGATPPATPNAAPTAAPAAAGRRDVHSFARPAEARVTDVALDLRADFAAKQLAGAATLTVDAAGGAEEVVLDTRDLAIERVSDASGRALSYTLGAGDSIRGRPLTVALPAGVRKVVVRYHTSPSAGALQWLTPAQTAGKRQPYLFSQGQSILTRTWIPTQDSPGIRQTYSARIVVPAGLRAVMSAEQLTPDGRPAAGTGTAFEFRLTHPIPPYLIALAVGDIAFRALGPRTGVYTEPAMLDRVAYEFADNEKMVEAAEALFGPYRWGRYDVLVLPPSFPFGGMENPRLTFATPTIIAGDRSLVSLVAHELAHSWSGNLVTNATWSDFWLNEGFTSYAELRIMEQVYGKERAAMEEQLARRGLLDEIKGFGADTGETRLHLDLTGRDPDEGTTDIAYDKGAAFLRLIELTVGRERFDAYLKGYLDRHAFQSITTADFLADLGANLIKGDDDLERRLRIDEWVYGTGLPSNAPPVGSAAFARVEAQAAAFAGGTAAASLATKGWSTQEWQHFLESLPDTLPAARLTDLDRTFALSRTGNGEVMFDWLRIAIRNRYEPAMPALERFLTTQGRRKFVKPLFEDLVKTDWGKAEARRIYAVARPGYHPVTSSAIDPIVRD